MKIPLATVLLAVAIAAGCASSPAYDTYSGEYFYNFEWASFFPDGNEEERWCVKGDMSEAELPATHVSGPWGTSHVVVQGTVGPLGSYGNLGACKRVLTVTKLIKVSNMRGRE
jgi:hypothetical protein